MQPPQPPPTPPGKGALGRKGRSRPRKPKDPAKDQVKLAADLRELGQKLEEVDQFLQALKARYIQVQTDQTFQTALQERWVEGQQELSQNPSDELWAEVRRIELQLSELEISLESRLFSWHTLGETFWQLLRFGGAGVILGWLLRSVVGG